MVFKYVKLKGCLAFLNFGMPKTHDMYFNIVVEKYEW